MLVHYFLYVVISCQKQVAQNHCAVTYTLLSELLISRYLLFNNKSCIKVVKDSFPLDKLIACGHTTEDNYSQ